MADKVEYTEFINRIKQGGKPIITLVENSYSIIVGTQINLYNFITIKDNEDGVIESNSENVKITTNLDTSVPGLYTVEYEVTDFDKNVSTISIEITVLEELQEESKVTSKIYTIKDFYISRIEAQTTIAEFKQNIESNNEITVIDNEGNEVEDDTVICTGMKVKIGKKLEYTAIVIGDVNGDGKISVTDIAKIKLHLIEKEILTSSQYIAGDINDDGKVNSADAVQLRNYLLDSSIFTEKQIIAADLNNDNSVDSFDMVFMRRILINQK